LILDQIKSKQYHFDVQRFSTSLMHTIQSRTTNGILMQQEPDSLKQDYWNRRAIASLANTLFTVVEPVPMPLMSSMLLLQL
jgi:hypothetical protein